MLTVKLTGKHQYRAGIQDFVASPSYIPQFTGLGVSPSPLRLEVDDE